MPLGAWMANVWTDGRIDERMDQRTDYRTDGKTLSQTLEGIYVFRLEPDDLIHPANPDSIFKKKLDVEQISSFDLFMILSTDYAEI